MKKNGKYGKRRGNHCGTLVKKGNSWMARWTVKIESEFVKDENGSIVLDKNGQPKHPTRKISIMTGATTIEQAHEFLDRKTRELGLDQPNELLERLLQLKASVEEKRKAADKKKEELEKAKPGLLISEGFKAYLGSPRRNHPSERGTEDYRAHYELFAGWVKKNHPTITEIRHITSEIAGEYAAHLMEERSSGTYNKRIGFLRSCWGTLATIPAAKLPPANPWDGIRRLKGTDVEKKRPFTVDELMLVGPALSPNYRFLFLIGLCTGLRLIDCALLEWNQVDLKLNKIELEPRKTKEIYHRLVILPIHPALGKALSNIPPEKRIGYVIPEIAEAYEREPSNVTNYIQDAIMSVGIKAQVTMKKGKTRNVVGFHSLRHFFSTWLQDARIPYGIVEKMLAHSPKSMTGYYYHENLAMLSKAITSLPTISTLSWENVQLEDKNHDVIDVAWSEVHEPKINSQNDLVHLLEEIDPKDLKAALAQLRGKKTSHK